MAATTTTLDFVPSEHPHMRYNPLNGEWVLISPHRMKRPWLGQIENYVEDNVPEFDPNNPLCPGVKRGGGELNPDYKGTFVFQNDFPALLEKAPAPDETDEPLFQIQPAVGTCRVMCFHPLSNMTIPKMKLKEVVSIVDSWIDQQTELSTDYTWVQIFENRGAIMGCSNPHPHCQIWATKFLPNEPRVKDLHQLEYYRKTGRPMLLDYVAQELAKQERVVLENDDWVVVVPYWALWPFETLVLPKTHIKRFTDLATEDPKRVSLAAIVQQLVTKYDNLFRMTFPYTMGWHGAPTGPKLKEDSTHWTFHGIYLPPMLRSATIKKFMVGYEMLAQGQRDLTPESAAQRLRDLPDIHYSVVQI